MDVYFNRGSKLVGKNNGVRNNKIEERKKKTRGNNRSAYLKGQKRKRKTVLKLAKIRKERA